MKTKMTLPVPITLTLSWGASCWGQGQSETYETKEVSVDVTVAAHIPEDLKKKMGADKREQATLLLDDDFLLRILKEMVRQLEEEDLTSGNVH